MGCKMILALAIAMVCLASFSANAQIVGSPCSTSMLTSFTPCMNFITNSSVNATTPTSDCCNVLKTVMSNGTGCMCLIATGAIPFNIPVNRSLALSLPQACNMPGVPLQCKAAGIGAPAPSPLASSPAASPSPTGSEIPTAGVSPTLAPDAPTDAGVTPPAGTTTGGGSATPAENAGNRQSHVTPSPSAAASTSVSFSPLFLVALVGAIAMKNY